METTAFFKARCLKRDLGIEAGIRYAENIARMGGISATSYTEAADILRTERAGKKELRTWENYMPL